MESFPKTEVVEVSRFEKVRGAWMNHSKQISYPVAFVLSMLSTEVAQAAEIEPSASLEEGIAVLEQAAEQEAIETAAAYITLPDGTSYWYSVEGAQQSVNLFTGHEGEGGDQIASFLMNVIESNELVEGQSIDIDHFHNHPMKSLFADYSGKEFSIPPSGQGFLADGDTGFFKQDVYSQVISVVSQETGIDISYVQNVVDTLGVWSWSQVPGNELADNELYQLHLELDSLRQQYEGRWEQETEVDKDRRMVIEQALETAREDFRSAYNSWLDFAAEGSYDHLPALIEAYRTVGIEMSFTPHEY